MQKKINEYSLVELKALAFDLRNDLEIITNLIRQKMDKPEVVELDKPVEEIVA
jgi:hypothetical protein